MAYILFSTVLVVSLVVRPSLSRPSPKGEDAASKCHRADTGYAQYNSEHCKFYRCDGGQLNRLHCQNAGSSDIRAALDSYSLSSGIKSPLFLEINGAASNHELILSDSTLGNAASLIHKLTIKVADLRLIDKNVWRSMPNMKILDLSVNTNGDLLTSDFFTGAAGIESLSLDVGKSRVNLTRSTVTMKSLQCFNLRGTNFVCDCAMQDIMRKAPVWRMTQQYENPLVEGDMWECGTATGAKCGNFPHQGKFLTKFTFPDCPVVPFPPVTNTPLTGSVVSCDYKNLRIRLRNVGIVKQLEFRLNGSSAPECQGRYHGGAVHFDIPVTQCGTNVTVDRAAKTLVMKNKVVVVKKNAGEKKKNGRAKAAQLAGGKEIPIECKLDQQGDLSQQFQAPGPYPMQQGNGQVRVKMDVLPTTSLGGGYAFDITLDTTVDGNWAMSVEDCWATPSNNASDPDRHDIISEGCFVDPSVQMTAETSEQSVRQTFTMDDFQFARTDNAQVYIHCEVDPCGQENGYCRLAPEERCRKLGGTTERVPSGTTLHATLKPVTTTEKPVTEEMTTEAEAAVTTESTVSETALSSTETTVTASTSEPTSESAQTSVEVTTEAITESVTNTPEQTAATTEITESTVSESEVLHSETGAASTHETTTEGAETSVQVTTEAMTESATTASEQTAETTPSAVETTTESVTNSAEITIEETTETAAKRIEQTAEPTTDVSETTTEAITSAIELTSEVITTAETPTMQTEEPITEKTATETPPAEERQYTTSEWPRYTSESLETTPATEDVSVITEAPVTEEESTTMLPDVTTENPVESTSAINTETGPVEKQAESLRKKRELLVSRSENSKGTLSDILASSLGNRRNFSSAGLSHNASLKHHNNSEVATTISSMTTEAEAENETDDYVGVDNAGPMVVQEENDLTNTTVVPSTTETITFTSPTTESSSTTVKAAGKQTDKNPENDEFRKWWMNAFNGQYHAGRFRK